MKTKQGHGAAQTVETDIPIGDKIYKAKLVYLRHEDLKFYGDNPRVYSIVHDGSGRKWSQEDIEDLLKDEEHVRVLREEIRKHGGLIEALYVKESTMEVVEGNSRLAAFRLLASENAVKWEHVKCAVLPKNISDSAIAALLGQLHLKGKKDWKPYEQASFLYRRHKQDKIKISQLKNEAPLSEKDIKHKINVISFMIKHRDNTRSRWSHYDELLKSRAIQKACEDHSELEQAIVDKIKNDEIKAQEVRSKLKAVCSTKSDKPIEALIAGESLEGALKVARSHGGDHTPLQRIKKFAHWIGGNQAKRGVSSASGRIEHELKFELRKIRSGVDALLKRLA